jgi:hypothetical protein
VEIQLGFSKPMFTYINKAIYIFLFVSMTSTWRPAYPLYYREGKTRNEKRTKGNVGN